MSEKRGRVTMVEAVAIAVNYAAGFITRAEAERQMFTDEELKMTPEERRAGRKAINSREAGDGPRRAD